MRMQLRSLAATLVGFLGVFALHTTALAGGGDPWSDVRGSLGTSLTDLSVQDGGAWFFLLNAAFALAFLIAARMLARHESARGSAPRGAYRDIDHVTTLPLIGHPPT